MMITDGWWWQTGTGRRTILACAGFVFCNRWGEPIPTIWHDLIIPLTEAGTVWQKWKHAFWRATLGMEGVEFLTSWKIWNNGFGHRFVNFRFHLNFWLVAACWTAVAQDRLSAKVLYSNWAWRWTTSCSSQSKMLHCWFRSAESSVNHGCSTVVPWLFLYMMKWLYTDVPMAARWRASWGHDVGSRCQFHEGGVSIWATGVSQGIMASLYLASGIQSLMPLRNSHGRPFFGGSWT